LYQRAGVHHQLKNRVGCVHVVHIQKLRMAIIYQPIDGSMVGFSRRKKNQPIRISWFFITQQGN
jgi:hypothetical protein